MEIKLTLDNILLRYICYDLCSSCQNDSGGISDYDKCERIKDFKQSLRELIEKLPISLIETSFDGVEQKYERAVLLKNLSNLFENKEGEK